MNCILNNIHKTPKIYFEIKYRGSLLKVSVKANTLMPIYLLFQYRPIASIKQLNLMTSKAPISTVKQDGVSDTESTSSTHEENDNHTVTKSPEEPMDKKD